MSRPTKHYSSVGHLPLKKSSSHHQGTMAFSLLIGGALSCATVADDPGGVVSVSGLFGRRTSAAGGFEAPAVIADLSNETFDMVT